MTAERDIDYEALAQDAMRGMVRTILVGVAKTGLPGEHHFYIAFSTTAPGVVVSKRLKEKYPEEMTVVLQHRFWDLTVTDTYFAVQLTFDGIPERLTVPFSAIKVFFDPSVPYGLQFEDSDLAGDTTREIGSTRGEDLRARPPTTRTGKGGIPEAHLGSGLEKKPRTQRKPRGERGAERSPEAGPDRPAKPQLVAPSSDKPEVAANDTKIVNIDQFRKK